MATVLVEQQQIGGRTFIHIFKWGQPKEVLDDFYPYCYILPAEANRAPKHWVVDGDYRTIDGRLVTKAIAKTPQEVKENRDRFTESWESDVIFTTRWMIDQLPREPIEEKAPRLVFLDIETLTKGRFIGARDVSAPICCFTVWLKGHYYSWAWREDFPAHQELPGADDWTVHLTNTEPMMLKLFADWFELERPEVVSGWNVDHFDVPYILNRYNRLGMFKECNRLSPMRSTFTTDDHETHGRDLKGVIKGVAIFDLLRAYRKFRLRRQRSYRLGDVAMKELGVDKLKVDTSDMVGSWNDDWRKVLFYNKRDVELCVQLDAKMGIIDTYIEVHHVSHCPFTESIHVAIAAETFLMKRLGLVVNNRKKRVPQEYEGADIEEPSRGVHERILVLDLKGMYTANICTINASFETLRSPKMGHKRLIKLDDELAFAHHDQVKGRIPAIIEELLDSKLKWDKARKAAKFGTPEWELPDRRRYGYKQVLNTFYGLVGNPNGRFYNPKLAKAVTKFGRMVIGAVKDHLRRLGATIVYSHTDSVYILSHAKSRRDMVKEGYKYEADINGFLIDWGVHRGIDPKHNRLEVEFDSIDGAGFFDKKNRYAVRVIWREGHNIDPPELETTGLDLVRSDCPPFAADLQEAVIELILDGEDSEVVYLFVQDELRRVDAGEIAPTDLAVKKGISKYPDEYKPKQPWHRGAIYANEHMGKAFGPGSTPRYIRVKSTPGDLPPTDVVCIEDDEDLEGFEIDMDAMTKVTVKKLAGVFDAVGMDIDRILLSGQKSLAEWA